MALESLDTEANYNRYEYVMNRMETAVFFTL